MSSIKVLIVEDEAFVAEHLRLILSTAGYEIIGTVATGKGAIDVFNESNPDIVIMDIKLKGKMDGIETAKKIHESARVPLIFLTDLDNPETIERAKSAHPSAYIIKPFNERQIIASVYQAIFNASHSRMANLNDPHVPKEDQFLLNGVLFLRLDNNHFKKVPIEDVLYIKADGAYASIHTENGGKFTYSISLNHLHDKIASPNLVRVHRTYVVNTDKVTEIKGNQLLIGKTEIQIGETYKSSVMSKFPIIK